MNVKENSQRNAIISHLRKYGKITSLEAIKRYGATRLSGFIFVLRKHGFVIRTEIKTVKNRYNSTSNIAIYYLEKDIDDK